MAENTSTFTGAAADGTALTAVYLTQPAANVAIGLCLPAATCRASSTGAARWPSPTPCWPPMTP